MPPAANVEVGVGAWIEREGCLLMVLRGEASSGTGQWAIPGGWLEFGESAEEACVREVKEETGLTVVTGDRLDFLTVEHSGLWIVILVVACSVEGSVEPMITEPEKCPAVVWIPLDQVTGLPLFGGTAEFVRLHPELLNG